MRSAVILTAFIFLFPGFCFTQGFQQDELIRAAEKYDNRQYREVVEILEPLTEDSYVPQGVYQLLISAYMQKGNQAEALRYTETGINEHTGSLDLRLLEVELHQQNPGRALRMLRETIRDKQSGRLHSERFTEEDLYQFKGRIFMVQGQQYLTQGQYERAIESFSRAAELLPDNADSYRGWLYAYHQAGQFEELLQAYDEVPESLQQDQQIMALHSRALIELEEINELTEIYRIRYDQNPGDLENALIYGQLLIENNELLKANELYNELLEAHPEERLIYDHLLDMNQRQMNFEETVNLLERMVEVFPDDEQLPLELAEAYQRMDRTKEAIAVYDSLEQQRGAIYEIVRPKAAMLFEQDQKEQAYREIIRSEKGQGIARQPLDLGMIAFQKNDYDNAATHFSDYLQTNPSDSLALILIGRSYLKTNQNEKAINAYQKATELGAHWPEAYLAKFRIDAEVAESKQAWLEAFSNSLKEKQAHREMLALQAQVAMQTGGFTADQPFYPPEKQYRDIRESLHELQDYALEFLAVETLETLLWELKDKHGDYGGIYEMAGDFYRQQDDTDTALELYLEGASTDPDNRNMLLRIAEINERRDNTGEAILWYERALSIEATPDVYSSLIKAHRQNGTLDSLIDRWLIRYHSGRRDPEFREHLIEALHRAGRSEEAREIVRD